jgi:hypothetical protein
MTSIGERKYRNIGKVIAKVIVPWA